MSISYFLNYVYLFVLQAILIIISFISLLGKNYPIASAHSSPLAHPSLTEQWIDAGKSCQDFLSNKPHPLEPRVGLDIPLTVDSPQRQSFIKTYLHYALVAEESISQWMRWADASDRSDFFNLPAPRHLQLSNKAANDSRLSSRFKILFIHLEHARLSEGNKITNNQDLITAINNYFFSSFWHHLSDFICKSSDHAKILGTDTNFKLIRIAVRVPTESNFNDVALFAYANAISDLQNIIVKQKLIRLSSSPFDYGNIHTWFKLGIGETADSANSMARLVRLSTNPEQHFIPFDQHNNEHLLTQLKTTENLRLKIIDQLKNSAFESLLTANPYNSADSNIFKTSILSENKARLILHQSVFSIFRKIPDFKKVGSGLQAPQLALSKVQQRLKSTFDLAILPPLQLVEDIFNYIQNFDIFSTHPRISPDERSRSPSLLDAEYGGFASDLIKAGALNYYVTAALLAGNANDLTNALNAGRQAELIVTQHMDQQRERIQQAAFEIFGQDTIEIDCSFDDCVGRFKKRIHYLSEGLRRELYQRFLNKLASYENPKMHIRVAFIDAYIYEPSFRSAIAAHGLALEKSTREVAEASWPTSITDSLVLGIHIKTKELNQGQIEAYVGKRPGPLPTIFPLSTSIEHQENIQKMVNRILGKNIIRLNRKLGKAAQASQLLSTPHYELIEH